MEKRIGIFIDDLVALCAKHKMALVSRDEYGIAIVPAPVRLRSPAIVEIWNVGPSGINKSADLVYGTSPDFLDSIGYVSPEHYVEDCGL